LRRFLQNFHDEPLIPEHNLHHLVFRAAIPGSDINNTHPFKKAHQKKDELKCIQSGTGWDELYTRIDGRPNPDHLYRIFDLSVWHQKRS
jgi:hypothetical protein